MTIETTVRQLEAEGIPIPDRVLNALGIIAEAQNYRGVSRDASAELASAFRAGELTRENFGDQLRDALLAQLTSRIGPNGALSWEVSLSIEKVADASIRQWLAIEWDEILDLFSERIDAAAAKLAEALPKALPVGSDPQTILKYGKRGIEAADTVAEAESELSGIVYFLRSVGAEIDEELPLSRLISGEDGVPLPIESGIWSEYLRAGFRIGLVSPERAAQSEAVAAQLAHEAAADEWRGKIRAEAERLAELRERGLRPNWSAALPVPQEFEHMIAEEVAKLGFGEHQFTRNRPVRVS